MTHTNSRRTHKLTPTQQNHKHTFPTNTPLRGIPTKTNKMHTSTTKNQQITFPSSIQIPHKPIRPAISTLPTMQNTRSQHPTPFQLHTSPNQTYPPRFVARPRGSRGATGHLDGPHGPGSLRRRGGDNTHTSRDV